MLLAGLVSCSSSKQAGSTTTTAPANAPTGTVWLCRPGQPDNPCATSLDAAVVRADGSASQQPTSAASKPAADCFYVYPTVSVQKTANADLTVDPEERSVAVEQAARFSQDCAVWAPMYRQRTVNDIGNAKVDGAAETIAFTSLLRAWRDYLAHDNHGRPVVFIGHSQGAVMLIRLLRQAIDPNPSLRSQLVSAVLLGGNVQVADGKNEGGSFQHLPLCTRDTSQACVIAYSTFPGTPPPYAYFGRAGLGVSFDLGAPAAGQQVACVDPTALGGGKVAADSYFAGEASTASPKWVEYPGRYDVQCKTADGASWLDVQPAGGTSDHRPTVSETLGPLWGYHTVDVNLLLGNLVDVVGRQIAAHR